MLKSKLKKKLPPNGLLQSSPGLDHPIYSEWLLGTQMSSAAMVTEAFYSNFLAYFTSTGEGADLQNRQTWLHKLPSLSSDGTNQALTLALRATAAAYCGTETGDPAVVQESIKMYGQALSEHSKLLRRMKREITVHMVSTSVMLSLFEAIRATTADAYREHIYGAARMLEATGAGQCLNGVLCQLFFHIRTQMAFVYMTTQKQATKRLEVRKILVETLRYEKLPTFQRLMSYVATLAELYVAKTSTGSKQRFLDLSAYARVKAEVDVLWLEYQEQAAIKEEQLYWQDESGQTTFRDGFTALSISYFSTARLLFSILAPRYAAMYIDLTDYYGLILDCARYLRALNIGCAYMRLATPLYLVALHSPKEEQRKEARAVFEGWKGGTMGGVSLLALDALSKRREDMLNWEDNWLGDLEGIQPNEMEQTPWPFDDWIGHGATQLEQQHQTLDQWCPDSIAVGLFRIQCPDVPQESISSHFPK
ncbi:hypothetical protein BDV96DRAFT_653497 [Lophiotrema nucula]|uniref:Fungal-specific transcription factor domain-containing protein n=1 Tax=Lophiotrema nucula TaxID=690887 RepID=A0A6A5YKC7_9PLEO|nr:hypothetical protein BDV96DRAFT_653497 [Lophiotrema nucula]